MTNDKRTFDSNKKLTERLDVDFALQAAQLGIWEYNPTTGQVHWDERAQRLFGIAQGKHVPYEQAIQYIHPDDVQRVDQAVQQATNPQSDGRYDQTYRTIGMDDGQLRWVRFQGRSYFTSSGELQRFGGIAQEVTQQVLAQQTIEQSQQQLLSQFEQAPVGIATISGQELTFRSANPFYGQIVGRSPQQLVGKTLSEVIPEMAESGFDTLLRNVLTSGESYTAQEVLTQLMRQGRLETAYFSFTYQPYWLVEGKPTGILMIAHEVTSQVLARQQLADSEARFRTLIDEAPLATSLFVGRELRVAVANEPMLAIWGKGPNQVGKTLAEILPEIANQPFLSILDQVYTSGQTYSAKGGRADLVYDGVLGTYYFDFIYKPLFDASGQVYGILQMATDVTEQVLASQQVEQAQQVVRQSEARLQKAIASKTVGVLFFNLKGKVTEANQTFVQLSGYSRDQLLNLSDWKQLTDTKYWDITAQSAHNLAHHGETPPYEKQMVRPDGSYWWGLFAPTRLSGEGSESECMEFVIDITARKQAEESLRESEAALQNAIELAELGTWRMDCLTGETQLSPRHADMFGLDLTLLPFEQAFVIVHPDDRPRVRVAFEAAMQLGSDGHYEAEYRIIQGRTGQHRHIRARGETHFDEAGQPVFISGTAQDITLERESQRLLEEQVVQRTQELQLANIDLQRSNDNLQQFAYIASHDLQEPLRKIQSFSTLLEQQLEGQLTELSRTYLQRISSAGARMSTLIKDLLTYSRISTRQQAFGLVSLEAILDQVRSTLEWVIAERNVQLETDELPVIHGDESQLSQLFQNLLANAIKFTPVGQTPQIQIQCFQRERHELPASVRPTSEASRFVQISIRDQGVGFDLKYVNRIFQVFQRLHGRNEFPGTGVGLAICQRVVENHGGAITADSKPGDGATFCVYLPA